jgi:chromate transporter
VTRSSAADAARPHELNRRLSIGLFVLLTGLAGWTAYLALHLPGRYSAEHWDLAWVGFDTGLIIVLGYTAWAAWFRRQILVATALVAATLLVCDAWFDVVMSFGGRDQWVTVATALLVELPLAGFFVWLARRIMLRTVTAFRAMSADPHTPPRRLRDAPLLFAETRTDAAVDPPEPVPPTVSAGEFVPYRAADGSEDHVGMAQPGAARPLDLSRLAAGREDATSGDAMPVISIPSLVSLFVAFFVVGLTSFGMAILQNLRSVPVRRGWLRSEDIDEGLALVQLYPGAVMVDLVAFIGYRTRRVRGAIVSVVGFVLPSLVLMLGLSWAYWSYGAGQSSAWLVRGLTAIVVGVLIHVTLDFAAKNAVGWLPAVLAVGGFAALVMRVNPLWAVLGGLVVGVVGLRPTVSQASPATEARASRSWSARRLGIAALPALVVATVAVVVAAMDGQFAALTGDMLKIGTVAFGNGATILPVLQHDVVGAHGWLTSSQFAAGIGFGQVTPGPFLITAGFVGYRVAGFWGGIAAVAAIFAPSVAMTTIAAELYSVLSRFPAVRAALRGVMAVFVGLLASVVVSLSPAVLAVPAAEVLAAAALVAVRVLRWNLLAVFGSGMAGWVIYLAATGHL